MIQSNINLDIKRVIFYRQFCNKLWNIIKFALGNLPEGFQPVEAVENLKLNLIDQWMLTKLNTLCESVNKNMEEYKFGENVLALQEFWLRDLADVYIEAIKPIVKGDDEEARKASLNTLFLVLDHGMKILHPFMPYVTEELFQRLPKTENTPKSICIAKYPTGTANFAGSEDKVALLKSIVLAIRSQLTQLNMAKNAKPHIVIRAKQASDYELIKNETLFIITLAKIGKVDTIEGDAADPEKCVKTHLSENVQIFTNVIGLIDLNLEMERINKRQEKLDKLIEAQEKKMNIKDYELKVKEEVKKDNAEKIVAYQTERKENEKSIEEYKKLLEA